MARIRLGRFEVQNDRLPPVCMRCGEPATVYRRKTFSWHPQWVIILILAGVLVYVVVAMILTKRMTIRGPLCDRHRNHWLFRSWFAYGGLAAVILLVIAAVAFATTEQDGPRIGGETIGGLMCAGTAVLALIWLIAVVVLNQGAIRPVEITDRSMTLVKVSPVFAEALQLEREMDKGKPEETPRKVARRRRSTQDLDDPAARRDDDIPPDGFRPRQR